MPKGLAAVVLASIPLQQQVSGGELIQNITYSVVLLSIVITSFLVLLLDKTRLPDLYGWILTPSLPKIRFNKESSAKKLSKETEEITPAGRKLFGGSDKKPE